MDTPSLKTILVATDLSEASDELLRSAAGLARAAGGVLHVLHAFDLGPLPGGGPEPVPHTFPGRVEAVTSALREQVARTVPPGVALAEPRLEIYSPARAIVEWARALGADLIVLGPHSRRSVEAGFLGTTADAVVRRAPVPCLVVRRPLALPLEHVVVPVDLSPSTRVAIQVAAGWHHLFGRKRPGAIEVVHVFPGGGEAVDRATDEVPTATSLRIDTARILLEAGVEAGEARTRLLHADHPATAITAFAETSGAELIVMATHGYGAVKRALFGWTASEVARRAHCPVLLVPPALWRGGDGRERGEDASAEARDDDVAGETEGAEERGRWPAVLQTFTLRNAARLTRLEELHPALGAQVAETSRPLRGATFDPRDARVDLMFGELDSTEGHLTRSIARVTSVDVLTDDTGRDRALRIAHREGQTILTLDP